MVPESSSIKTAFKPGCLCCNCEGIVWKTQRPIPTLERIRIANTIASRRFLRGPRDRLPFHSYVWPCDSWTRLLRTASSSDIRWTFLPKMAHPSSPRWLRLGVSSSSMANPSYLARFRLVETERSSPGPIRKNHLNTKDGLSCLRAGRVMTFMMVATSPTGRPLPAALS